MTRPHEDGLPVLDLGARIPPTDLGDGWEVSSCDPGDARLICVFRAGQHVGMIEWLHVRDHGGSPQDVVVSYQTVSGRLTRG